MARLLVLALTGLPEVVSDDDLAALAQGLRALTAAAP